MKNDCNSFNFSKIKEKKVIKLKERFNLVFWIKFYIYGKKSIK